MQMGIDPSQVARNVIGFLIPHALMRQPERESVIISAFLGMNLHSQIDLGGSSAVFVPKLVERLASYGNMPCGRHPAVVLLQTMRQQVGHDIQAEIDLLCGQIEEAGGLRPHETPESTRLLSTSTLAQTLLDRDEDTTNLLRDDSSGAQIISVLVTQRIFKTPAQQGFILTGSDVVAIFQKGVEQGRVIEKKAMLTSISKDESHANAEQNAAKQLALIQAYIDDFNIEEAFRSAPELENILNQMEDFLDPDTLATGFELLANVEVMKHRAAGESGDPTARTRARQFILRARNASQRKN